MNTKQYRIEYAKSKEDTDKLRDVNFLGCYHYRNNKIEKKGFFHLYHGDKPSEIDFLRSQVEIAEDGQAIYEFLQNAVDANSTEFYIFWDKENFLVINNGKKFKDNEISSLLNFSQSTKSNDSKNKIGKFGIGFKLIHRLVGKSNGLDEIIDEYKGPILFSWDKHYIKKFLNNDLSSIDKHWLFKILYTNFPCGIDEKVKNKNFEETVLFPKSEYIDMIAFIKQQNINLESLKEGSLFFLKLGKEKSKLLYEEVSVLQNGIKYSLNIIHEFALAREKKINLININQFQIEAEELDSIKANDYIFLFPNHLKSALKFYKKESTEKISFFKFFPMGDQNNGLNFVLHSSEFDIESNRRKLHDTYINKNLLKSIAKDLKVRFNEIKDNDMQRYKNILANLYLSDLKNANHDKLIQENFTQYLFDYIKENIPYRNSDGSLEIKNDKSKIVIIESSFNNIPLKKFSNFYFTFNENRDITKKAIEKLKIKKMNIVDVILNDNINNWILELNDNKFKKLLDEISQNKKNSQKLVEIWNASYSLNEIKRILQIFKVLDRDIVFAILKNSNKKYIITTISRNFYIKDKMFKEFLEKTYESFEMDYYLIPDELEVDILEIIGKKSSDKKILKELLEREQHKEVIDFVKEDKDKEHFLLTLKKLELSSKTKYKEDDYELKVLDMILEFEDAISDYKKKIFIDNAHIVELSKSPYITFKYQNQNSSKVINPNSYDNDSKNDATIKFITNLDEKYKDIFHIEEESKESVYQTMKNGIKNNFRFRNKINTKNRLKFIILYSLEKEENFIKDFDGINILNKVTNNNDSIDILYKILSKDVAKKSNFNIFNISDFFPNTLDKAYYIKNEKFAINSEKLPQEINKKHIGEFKKIGLKLNTDIVSIRESILNDKELKSDDLIKLTQQEIINTIIFLAKENFEFKLKSIAYKNIAKLFKQMETEEKIGLNYYPCLKNKSSLKIVELNPFYTYYIEKTELNNKNKIFQKRLKKEIKNTHIIYFDILNIDEYEVNKRWKIIKESEEERNEEAKKENENELNELNSRIRKKTNYNGRKADIGRKGELFVKKILIDKFGAKRVIDNNENGENQKIDFEILDKNLNKVIHKIEVKATVNNINNKSSDSVEFYMSKKQYKYAQQYDNNTHLIFVTGVEDDNPEFLYMNFDNSWLH